MPSTKETLITPMKSKETAGAKIFTKKLIVRINQHHWRQNV